LYDLNRYYSVFYCYFGFYIVNFKYFWLVHNVTTEGDDVKTKRPKNPIVKPGIKSTVKGNDFEHSLIDNENLPHLKSVLKNIPRSKTQIFEAPDFDPSKYDEQPTTYNANVLDRVKHRLLIIIFMIFEMVGVRKGPKHKRKLSVKGRKALKQLEQLAALYQSNCHSDSEMMAFDAAFGQCYYEMLQYARGNGGNGSNGTEDDGAADVEFYASKMADFVELFDR